MTTSDSFERRVSDWLHQDAEYRVAPHLDAVLRRTRSERQRPAWSSLERWLPMQSSARFAQVPRYAWYLVVLGLVLALGASAIVVGSRIVKPPPSPFGADSRGSVLYGTADGEIHAIDTATNLPRPLITGPAIDVAPLASPDGATIAFTRREPGAAGTKLMVANADGSNVRALDAHPADVVDMAWSPDGQSLAIAGAVGGLHGLWIIGLDGGRSLVQAQVPGEDIALIQEPRWLPNGQKLLFLGGPLDTVAPWGIYLVGADGQGLSALVAPTVEGPDRPAVSPDGSKVVYALGKGDQSRLHVVDVDTGADAVIPFDVAASDQAPQWSPDGRSLAFERYHGDTYRLAVASADGGPVVELGPTEPYRSGGSQFSFSPDGTRIVAFYDADDSSWVLDPADRSAVLLDDEIDSPLSWQPPAP